VRRLTLNTIEIGVALLFLGLGALVLGEGLRLGPGWSVSGPEPGFFPVVMTGLMSVGALISLYFAIRTPDRRPFFEERQEVANLLEVGVPILLTIFAMQWLGLYLAAGLYLSLFMIFYGKSRWWAGIAGGVLMAAAFWLILVKFLTIPMPMSVFYKAGLLPF
jgi:hypothetical protein